MPSPSHTMRRWIISAVNRRIPKKWWILVFCVLIIYIISAHVLTSHKTPITLKGDKILSVPLFNSTERIYNSYQLNEDKNNNFNQIRKVTMKMTHIQLKHNNKPTNDGNPNETEKEGRQLIQEVEIPHLYFNNEGLDQSGEGVYINRTHLSAKDQKLYDQGYERNHFNEYVSNLISVDRSIPEARDPLCLNETYPSDLPDTSVIVTFLNEAWSVLVRSVHSIINTAPPHILREIILVDDFSDYDHLKAPLEVYMKTFPKVKIIRNSQREGLIRSRLNGAEVATGQVLTFLDSHIECATGWLPPLLARIKENASHVVWPSIPPIDRNTFKFVVNRRAVDMAVGVFGWEMNYSWEFPRVEDRETVISPIKSPTMAGGLFSIDREYFYHIGSYDEEMQFWGAENLELSFRIWMCGGTIEVIPCSLVGHVFRNGNPNSNLSNKGSTMRNTLRMVMVWLDEYKYLYSKVTGVKLENYGDITSRLELRQKLNCKTFDWYLKNVYTSVFLPEHAKISGLIHSVHDSTKCLYADNYSKGPVKVNQCDRTSLRTQIFFMTHFEELRLLEKCLDAGNTQPIMYLCHRMKGNQQFQYREGHTIFHIGKGKCLEWKENTNIIELVPCNGSSRQMWMWEEVSFDFRKKRVNDTDQTR